jgi:hypothetical protein
LAAVVLAEMATFVGLNSYQTFSSIHFWGSIMLFLSSYSGYCIYITEAHFCQVLLFAQRSLQSLFVNQFHPECNLFIDLHGMYRCHVGCACASFNANTYN